MTEVLAISSSYPFMSIAKQTGADYGEVLRKADQFRRPGREFDMLTLSEVRAMSPREDRALLSYIGTALHYLDCVRRGIIAFPPTSPVLDTTSPV